MKLLLRLLVIGIVALFALAIAGYPQMLSPSQEWQVRYELLRELQRTSPNYDRAWVDVDLHARRSILECALLSGEPPKWKFWRWRERQKIERTVQVLKALDWAELELEMSQR